MSGSAHLSPTLCGFTQSSSSSPGSVGGGGRALVPGWTLPVTSTPFPCPAEPLSSVSSLEVHFDLLDLTELTDMSDQELAEVFADSDDESLAGESPAGGLALGRGEQCGAVLGPRPMEHGSPQPLSLEVIFTPGSELVLAPAQSHSVFLHLTCLFAELEGIFLLPSSIFLSGCPKAPVIVPSKAEFTPCELNHKLDIAKWGGLHHFWPHSSGLSFPFGSQGNVAPRPRPRGPRKWQDYQWVWGPSDLLSFLTLCLGGGWKGGAQIPPLESLHPGRAMGQLAARAGLTPRVGSQLHRDLPRASKKPLLRLHPDPQVHAVGGLVPVFSEHSGDPSVWSGAYKRSPVAAGAT